MQKAPLRKNDLKWFAYQAYLDATGVHIRTTHAQSSTDCLHLLPGFVQGGGFASSRSDNAREVDWQMHRASQALNILQIER